MTIECEIPATEIAAPAAVAVRAWLVAGEVPPAEPYFITDGPGLPADLSLAGVLLATAGEARAAELIEAGAARVLLADAALTDSEAIRRLSGRFGSERVGVWLPVRRMAVNWTLDRVSNADFKCLTPSLPQPAWEVLTSRGNPTGTLAHWWARQMLERGAGCVLASLDGAEDADLPLCAGLVEDCGAALWLAPPADCEVPARAWSEYGQARQLVWASGAHVADTVA